MTADEITPNCAPLVAHAIGAERAAAFDIGAACTGFLAGLSQAAALIEVGRAQRILLIGAEKLTRITDFDDKKTGMLFGDGAGAVVLGPSDSGAGIGPIDLNADGGLGDTILATLADPYIRMDGISTFKIAIKRLSESTIFAVSAAGYDLSDIDLFVYHQANSRILKAVGERLELDPAKVADYIAQLGNTSAASIPLTLSLSREDGRAERILLIGAEKLTRITDFDDKKTGMLFGDGAGAVVLGPSDSDAGIGPIDLLADGGLADTIVATRDDPFIRMDGISRQVLTRGCFLSGTSIAWNQLHACPTIRMKSCRCRSHPMERAWRRRRSMVRFAFGTSQPGPRSRRSVDIPGE